MFSVKKYILVFDKGTLMCLKSSRFKKKLWFEKIRSWNQKIFISSKNIYGFGKNYVRELKNIHGFEKLSMGSTNKYVYGFKEMFTGLK